jgi:hypothetical protein
MRKLQLALLTALCGSALLGCSGPNLSMEVPAAKDPANAPPPLPSPPPPPSQFGDAVAFSLAEWLTKPRAELAELCDEWQSKVDALEQAHREHKHLFTLLPDLHLPKAVPVFREVKFSAKAGFSLPPYAKEGVYDNALALHVARFGDVDAARKLADPSAVDVRAKIDALAYSQNYPLEWTRLVALVLHTSQLRLAGGDLDGATELVHAHKQLRLALDPKAAQGVLGATLLPRGRQTLTQAVAAWQTSKQPILVEQATEALAQWDSAPSLAPMFTAGQSRDETARLLGSPATGHVIVTTTPLRALDLWELPLPADGLGTVVACCDTADRFVEALFFYRPRTSTAYPRPGDLAFYWEEARCKAADVANTAGVLTKEYTFGRLTSEVALIPQSNYLGAWVRIGGPAASTATALPRDLGVVNLNRSFEQNRLRLTPEQRATSVTCQQPKLLAQMKPALPGLKPAEAVLERSPEHNLVARVTVAYRPDEGATPPLGQLAQPLWSAFGPACLSAAPGEHGGQLLLRWEDASTAYILNLPFADAEGARLMAEDRHTDQNAYAEQVAAFDRAERQARFAAGKPAVRLPRNVEVTWATRPLALQLGMSKAEVLQAIPVGSSVYKRDFPGGLSVAFAGAPVRPQPFLPGQVFVRFDANERVAELRAIYVGGAVNASAAGWTKNLVAGLKKTAGAPQETPAVATAWSDLSQKPAGVVNEWLDDVTKMTCRCDPSGAELVLRACSEQYADGVPLPALDYLARGVEQCKLGDARADVVRRANVAQPTIAADGALVLSPPKGSPYDAVLVWFEKDQAVRIVARHAVTTSPAAVTPAQMSQQLVDAWGRDFPTLGWPQRRDHFSANVLLGFGWHDDRGRVRLFWEETSDSGLRLFTEWRTVK